jgi:hypothetical protein
MVTQCLSRWSFRQHGWRKLACKTSSQRVAAFRCDDPHECIALVDIEVPLRKSGYALDANGFRHDRMMRLLIGIRDNVSLPAIYIEQADPSQRAYRVREGVHRYHASLALGFSQIPVEIVERLY